MKSERNKKSFIFKRYYLNGYFLFLPVFLLFSFLIGYRALAVDGIMNGKFVTGATDNYLFWLQTYDDSTSPYFFDHFFVDKSGNIGVGNTAPSVKLDVGSFTDTSNNIIRVKTSDSYNAGFEAYGSSQGTGYLFVGQGSTYGGGMFYNGDGTPAFATGESADRISFYRMSNGTKEVVFDYAHNSNDVNFRGGINVAQTANLNSISFGTTPGESQTLALTTVEYVNAKVGGSAGITTGTTGQTLRHDGTGWVANSALYNNGTNIGIGTTNPGRKVSILDSYDNSAVEPNSDSTGLIVQNLGSGSHTVTNFHTSIALRTFDDSWYIRATEIANNNLDLSFGHQYSAEVTFNEKLRITSTGNVGIGTTGPAQKLHVVGVGYFQGTNGLYINPNIGGVGNAVISTDTGQNLRFRSGSSEIMFLGSTGNIGIGTVAPYGKLTVSGAAGITRSIVLDSREIKFRGDGVAHFSIFGPDTGQPYLTIQNTSSNSSPGFAGSDLFTIRSTGNIGIATTNPIQKLHVNGGAQLDSVSFGVTPGTTQKLALATVEYIDNMISGVSTSTVGYWSANGNHIYNANSANVGIGSSAPANKLDISGSLGVNGILKGYGSANGNFFEGKLGVNSLSAGASSLAVFGNAAIGTSYLSTSAPINGLIVQGNVGIATSTPAEALHIVGNLRVDGGATISGNLNMSGSTLIVNKITANTIDPLYTIGGVKYSTFAPSIVGGVKEEYVGRIYEDDFRKVGVEYEAVIDMSKLEEGSDLWVWHKVVDFSSDNVSVFLTPKGERASMYADIEGDKIVIRSDRVVDAYLRLIGSRYDWHEWPTKASDQNQPGGLLIN